MLTADTGGPSGQVLVGCSRVQEWTGLLPGVLPTSPASPSNLSSWGPHPCLLWPWLQVLPTCRPHPWALDTASPRMPWETSS